jgi:hypothetical protein
MGTARSAAAPAALDLFGSPAYFNDGRPLPGGRYRIRYVDGCMKYDSGQGWTVNAVLGTYCWYVVGENTSIRIVVPPGNEGYAVGQGGKASFDECVSASRAIPPVEFTVAAPSRLGVWLLDSPYGDNVPGVDGRNPQWALENVDGCAP